MNSTATARRAEAASPVPSSPRLGYAVVQTHDFDLVAHALRGMNLDLRQLSRGPFAGRVEAAELGPFRILRTAVNRVIQARGAVEKDRLIVSLVTGANEAASWRGQHRTQGDVNLNLPCSEIDHLTGQVYDSLSIDVDLERFRLTGLLLDDVDVTERLNGLSGWHASPPNFAALEGLARQILALHRSPSALLDSPTARNAIEETFTLRLLDALRAEPIHAQLPIPSRRRLVRLAEEFMFANLRRPVLMAELCEEFDVSQRSLRYAFQDCFGISPQAYFKVQKLNAIRRQIKDADGARGQVQQIARQWGIVHLGNFAADYRDLFGESPSESAREGHDRRERRETS